MRLNEIYKAYQRDMDFLCVYIREAHPDDGWRSTGNLEEGIRIKEPTTDDQRTDVASLCQLKLDLQMPMLIDSIGNDAESKYIAIPMRLFLVDPNGILAYAGAEGPYGFKPDEWQAAIKTMLGK